MKQKIRLTENDLTRLVKRVIKEQEDEESNDRLSWDKDSQFFRMKKAWSNFLNSAESEEELMDRVLNLADLASYRKKSQF